MNQRYRRAVLIAVATVTCVLGSAPVAAQSAREILTQASFSDSDEASALRRVTTAYAVAGSALTRKPDDR